MNENKFFLRQIKRADGTIEKGINLLKEEYQFLYYHTSK